MKYDESILKLALFVSFDGFEDRLLTHEDNPMPYSHGVPQIS